jgi:hypothetical protein
MREENKRAKRKEQTQHVPEPEPEPHMIDHTIPMDEWQGYWCPVDKKFHKDGTTMFCNFYCITCGLAGGMLGEKGEGWSRPWKPGV